jgi:hypothetical protein
MIVSTAYTSTLIGVMEIRAELQYGTPVTGSVVIDNTGPICALKCSGKKTVPCGRRSLNLTGMTVSP